MNKIGNDEKIPASPTVLDNKNEDVEGLTTPRKQDWLGNRDKAAKSEGNALIITDPGDRKLLRKLDWCILPTITLLYLLSYLDRVNIGQVNISDLSKTLGLSSDQYIACLSVFFATFVVFEIPSTLTLKRFRPSIWISLNMVIWGIIVTMMGLVTSYGSLIACRALLGAAEAGLFPGANFYLSGWYKRRELSWRIGFLFFGLAVAGAFGGILAYGISQMNGVSGQEGWRWLFYIEGIITVIIGILAFFFYSRFPFPSAEIPQRIGMPTSDQSSAS